MSIKVCPRCHYNTDRTNNLMRHYSKKIICKPLYSDISIQQCIENFSKKEDDVQIDNSVKNTTNTTTTNNITNNIVNNTTTNNTTNNNNITNNYIINVNSFDKTDYGYIKELLEECKKPMSEDEHKAEYYDIKRIIALLHFNEDHPENHNMYIKDSRTKTLMLHNGETFVESKNGVSGIEYIINTLCDRLYKKVDKEISKEIKRDYDQNTVLFKKKIRDNVFHTSHNLKHIPIETDLNLKIQKDKMQIEQNQ